MKKMGDGMKAQNEEKSGELSKSQLIKYIKLQQKKLRENEELAGKLEEKDKVIRRLEEEISNLKLKPKANGAQSIAGGVENDSLNASETPDDRIAPDSNAENVLENLKVNHVSPPIVDKFPSQAEELDRTLALLSDKLARFGKLRAKNGDVSFPDSHGGEDDTTHSSVEHSHTIESLRSEIELSLTNFGRLLDLDITKNRAQEPPLSPSNASDSGAQPSRADDMASLLSEEKNQSQHWKLVAEKANHQQAVLRKRLASFLKWRPRNDLEILRYCFWKLKENVTFGQKQRLEKLSNVVGSQERRIGELNEELEVARKEIRDSPTSEPETLSAPVNFNPSTDILCVVDLENSHHADRGIQKWVFIDTSSSHPEPENSSDPQNRSDQRFVWVTADTAMLWSKEALSRMHSSPEDVFVLPDSLQKQLKLSQNNAILEAEQRTAHALSKLEDTKSAFEKHKHLAYLALKKAQDSAEENRQQSVDYQARANLETELARVTREKDKFLAKAESLENEKLTIEVALSEARRSKESMELSLNTLEGSVGNKLESLRVELEGLYNNRIIKETKELREKLEVEKTLKETLLLEKAQLEKVNSSLSTAHEKSELAFKDAVLSIEKLEKDKIQTLQSPIRNGNRTDMCSRCALKSADGFNNLLKDKKNLKDHGSSHNLEDTRSDDTTLQLQNENGEYRSKLDGPGSKTSYFAASDLLSTHSLIRASHSESNFNDRVDPMLFRHASLLSGYSCTSDERVDPSRCVTLAGPLGDIMDLQEQRNYRDRINLQRELNSCKEKLRDMAGKNKILEKQIGELNETIKESERSDERLEHLCDKDKLTYLKNVIVKYISSTCVEDKKALLPVLVTLLRFTPEEQNVLNQASEGTTRTGPFLKRLFNSTGQ